MKNNVYTYFYLLTMLTTLLACDACKQNEQSPCQSASNTIVDLTSNELNKIPYNGHDTLYFKDINGDTNIVVGGGKQFYYDITYATVPPDCPQNKTIQNQAYKINFTPIKGDLSFTINPHHIDGSIRIIKTNYKITFFIEFGRLVDSLKSYGGIPMTSNGTTDNTYMCSYTLTNGLTYIKSSNENEEYSLINK